RLGALEAPYRELAEALGESLTRADDLEEKNQKRAYVLKALRQVCKDMGFADAGLHQEQPGDPASRLVLSIDPKEKGRGLITFHLSLAAIEANVKIAQPHCFEDFHKFEAELSEHFGVKTEFKMEDSRPLPRLKHEGAKEEPTSGGRKVRTQRRSPEN